MTLKEFVTRLLTALADETPAHQDHPQEPGLPKGATCCGNTPDSWTLIFCGATVTSYATSHDRDALVKLAWALHKMEGTT